LVEEAVFEVQWNQQFKEGLGDVSPERRGLDRSLDELGDQFWLGFLDDDFGTGSV
jgi:hypothetical protein